MKQKIWTEKFRPKTLDEIKGQEHVVKYLKAFVNSKDIPNMLFAGPPGTGKTASAIALCKDFYGKQWRNYFFEVNASDESKVEFMRTKIKEIANIPMLDQEFKVIFMDEADFLSSASQAVLRRVIEKSAKNCRFIFSCNYPNKIIPAISDRCVVFRFKSIKAKEMQLLMRDIAKQENLNITDSALYTLAVLSDGSMRRALTTLQKLKLGGIEEITDETIYETTNWINIEHIDSLLSAVKSGDFDRIRKRLNDLLYEKTYMPQEILKFLEMRIKELNLPMKVKLNVITNIGTIDYRISQGANPYLQLMSFMCYISKQLGALK